MTKTLLLAVTYIGVTVDSLFTSWWKGAWPILRPLPSPPLSVFCLWVISDGRLEPKSYALFFFFLFTSFFFSICTNNESFCYFVSIFFFFIYSCTLVKTKWWASKIFIVNKKKKNYCQWTSRLHYSSFIITNVHLLRGVISYIITSHHCSE